MKKVTYSRLGKAIAGMEPRLKFAMKTIKLHSMNHDMIMKELKRYRFISSIDNMNTEMAKESYTEDARKL